MKLWNFLFLLLTIACQPLIFDKPNQTEPGPEPEAPERVVKEVVPPVPKPEPPVVGPKHTIEVGTDVKTAVKTNTTKKVKVKFDIKVDTKIKIKTTANKSDKKETPVEGDSVDRIETVKKVHASIKFVEETAGFLNTFGWYKVDKANRIYDVQLIWENASQVGAQYGVGPLLPGDVISLGDIEQDVRLGFFIVANGFLENNWNAPGQPSYLDLNHGHLEFRDGETYSGDLATLASVSPRLWYVPKNGTPRAIESRTNEDVDYGFNAIYHTAASSEQSLQLNPDNVNHIRHHVLEAGKRFSIEIEDLYYTPDASKDEFDGDFADLIFELILLEKEVEVSPEVKSFGG